VAYLFGNSRSPLAQRLGARPIAPLDSPAIAARTKSATGHGQPVAQKNPPIDPLDNLTEIQRARQVELSRQQQTASRVGEPDGSH
ncbi:MAG: hypothetical protein WBY93_12820, partial [Candidatus Binatus sp.]